MKRFLILIPLCILSLSSAFADGLVIIESGACSPSYGAEINTTANASYPGAGDTNATTGWTNSGCVTFQSSSSAPQIGTYHMDFVADSNVDNVKYDFSGFSPSDGQLYRLSFYVRHNGTGGDWRYGLGYGSSSQFNMGSTTITSAETTYAQFTFLFYYNGQQDVFQWQEVSGTDDGGLYVDNFSLKAATPCLGSELHTSANAASIGNEADATTGWTSQDSLNSFTSESTGSPADGTYHLLADATTSPTANNGVSIDLGSAPFSLVDSTKYVIAVKVKHIGSGDTWIVGNSSAAGGSASISPYINVANTDTTYTTYGWEITYSASLRYFRLKENGSNNDGGVYIDAFTVKEVTSE